MKKQILTLMVTTAVFAMNSAFAMEQPPESEGKMNQRQIGKGIMWGTGDERVGPVTLNKNPPVLHKREKLYIQKTGPIMFRCIYGFFGESITQAFSPDNKRTFTKEELEKTDNLRKALEKVTQNLFGEEGKQHSQLTVARKDEDNPETQKRAFSKVNEGNPRFG